MKCLLCDLSLQLYDGGLPSKCFGDYWRYAVSLYRFNIKNRFELEKKRMQVTDIFGAAKDETGV